MYEENAYNEKTLCTAYKCEHIATHKDDSIFFLINFEGELGFDSDSAEIGGPFIMLKNEDLLEYYNLRYGAESTRSNVDKKGVKMVYVAEAIFLVIATI